MSRYISDRTRKEVIERAQRRCEYCKIFDRYSFLSFHIEHIISIKHGGNSNLQNLAYACPICNFNKGTDIATVLKDESVPIRFFHPRKDIWVNHFQIHSSGLINAQTQIAKATIKILDFNHPDSIIEREMLIRNGLF